MPLLTLDKISKRFFVGPASTPVLHEISFEVHPGEILCLLGPTGSGKTTLLNIVAGVETPSSGTVLRGAQRIGYVPQRDLLLPWRTNFQNLTLGLEILGQPSHSVLQTIEELARRYSIEHILDDRPEVLSGGMRQLVSYIRTLVTNADVYLLDEPLSSMDFDLRLRVANDITRLIRGTTKAAILVTHNIEEAVAVGSRIILLGGRPARAVGEELLTFSRHCPDAVSSRLSPQYQHHLGRVLTLVQAGTNVAH